jgi:hypothetical protein
MVAVGEICRDCDCEHCVGRARGCKPLRAATASVSHRPSPRRRALEHPLAREELAAVSRSYEGRVRRCRRFWSRLTSLLRRADCSACEFSSRLTSLRATASVSHQPSPRPCALGHSLAWEELAAEAAPTKSGVGGLRSSNRDLRRSAHPQQASAIDLRRAAARVGTRLRGKGGTPATRGLTSHVFLSRWLYCCCHAETGLCAMREFRRTPET